MKRTRINFPTIFGLFLTVCLCANASARIQSIKLLTPKIGWVANENNLYWTTDIGNTWHIITPQWGSEGSIAAVFFLNPAQGWILYCNKSDKIYKYKIAYTKDSGNNWSISDFKLPKAIVDLQIKRNNREDYVGGDLFEGSGWIDFLDTNRGWMLLDYHVSVRTDYSSGILFKTEDGGKFWKQVGGDLPTAGRFHFVTTQEGWLAGHKVTNLYVTHNGGDIWKEAVYPAPPPQVPTTNCWHDLPIFKDSQHGSMPITYVSGDLVLFSTNNGGKTWKPDWVLSNLGEVGGVYPSTMVDSILITAVASENERSLTLIKVLPDGNNMTTKTYAFKIMGDIKTLNLFFAEWWKFSFINTKQGWISSNDQLLSTDDGGENWSVITPQ